MTAVLTVDVSLCNRKFVLSLTVPIYHRLLMFKNNTLAHIMDINQQGGIILGYSIYISENEFSRSEFLNEVLLKNQVFHSLCTLSPGKQFLLFRSITIAPSSSGSRGRPLMSLLTSCSSLSSYQLTQQHNKPHNCILKLNFFIGQ